MTVRCTGTTIHLEGSCPVEEAETLAGLLEEDPARRVDLTGCDHLHGALVQTLLAFRPRIQGVPEAGFMRDHLLPALVFGVEREEIQFDPERTGKE